MKYPPHKDLSKEAKILLANEWPKAPKIDYSDIALVKPLLEGFNAYYKEISETFTQKISFKDTTINGVKCTYITPKKTIGDKLIFHIPGGGGIACSPRTHYSIVASIATEMKCNVLSIDYPKTPENTYPIAQDAIENTYDELLKRHDASSILIVADSSGAFLTMNLLLRCKAKNRPLPKAIALVCPFVDLTCSGNSYNFNREFDPSYDDDDVIKSLVSLVVGSADINDPLISTLNADMSGFPPTIIQAAGIDIMLSDAVRLQRKLRQSGVLVDFDVWEGLWHNFQANQTLPEAKDATKLIAHFLMSHSL